MPLASSQIKLITMRDAWSSPFSLQSIVFYPANVHICVHLRQKSGFCCRIYFIDNIMWSNSLSCHDKMFSPSYHDTTWVNWDWCQLMRSNLIHHSFSASAVFQQQFDIYQFYQIQLQSYALNQQYIEQLSVIINSSPVYFFLHWTRLKQVQIALL